jgi:hypothetical protein
MLLLPTTIYTVYKNLWLELDNWALHVADQFSVAQLVNSAELES